MARALATSVGAILFRPKGKKMACDQQGFTLEVSDTNLNCPIGETVGQLAMSENKIPVLSCEGACIRGEIARQAANMIAKEEPYGRGCHGELFTVPHSTIARWIQSAKQVVVVDGCFLRCHGRVLEHMLSEDQLLKFDALAVYKKYNDIFDAEDVPVADRLAAARQVADSVLAALNDGSGGVVETLEPEACCN